MITVVSAIDDWLYYFQVMQSHGMGALRDNPEMMGTSVGMLRRAASIIKMLTKVR